VPEAIRRVGTPGFALRNKQLVKVDAGVGLHAVGSSQVGS